MVITIIAILASMLLPTLSNAKSKAQAVGCLNNLKQLDLAWHLYQTDNNGKCVLNAGAFNVNLNSWVTGWMDWTSAGANTNQQYLLDGALGPYTAKTLGVYKCPAEPAYTINQHLLSVAGPIAERPV